MTRGSFSLLASELPQAVDGPEALALDRGAHDVIDHGLLERRWPACPDDAAQVRDACARWSRLRFAVDATAYPRPDAWCSPGRGHVHNGACHCRRTSKTAPGWEYQFTAAVGHLRTAWAALVDVARTTPATRTAQTIAQVKNVLRRLRAAGAGRDGAPLFVFDAGLQRRRPHRRAGRAAPCTCWSGWPAAACSTPSPSPGTARPAVPASTASRSPATTTQTTRTPNRTSP